MKRSISIQDIAQAAGVSHTTVSRALRNSPLISIEVRENIQRLAQEMGYVPNAVAQSLRGQRTDTIGLVVTTIADPFVGRVVRGIEEAAQKYNLSLLLSVSGNDPDREALLIENFHRRRVDGIIVAAARMTAEHEKLLERVSVPTVLINPQSESQLEYIHTVSVDDYAGARMAMAHLLALGHRAIGYLGAGNRPRSNRIRLEAYRDALLENNIPLRAELVRTAPPEHRYHSDDVMDGQTLFPQLVENGATAIFCYNDMIAAGALLACRVLGIHVPTQLSVVGFDDVEMAQLVTPPLTTVHQPKLRLGQVAMEMVLDLRDGKPIHNAILSPDLVLRSSTARAPGILPRDVVRVAGAIRPDQMFSPPQ